MINRTINNIAHQKDWLDIAPDDDAADIADIANSDDASRNKKGNGAHKFDGKLDFGNSTGRYEKNYNGKLASMTLPQGKDEVMIVISVNDVADKVYDSAAVIDWIRFK
jgi:hypothetical protein